jgi:hypothetical protein
LALAVILYLILTRVPRARVAVALGLLPLGVGLLGMGLWAMRRLGPVEQRVVLGIGQVDPVSGVMERLRDAGVPLSLGIGAIGVALLLLAWAMPAPRAAQETDGP